MPFPKRETQHASLVGQRIVDRRLAYRRDLFNVGSLQHQTLLAPGWVFQKHLIPEP